MSSLTASSSSPVRLAPRVVHPSRPPYIMDDDDDDDDEVTAASTMDHSSHHQHQAAEGAAVAAVAKGPTTTTASQMAELDSIILSNRRAWSHVQEQIDQRSAQDVEAEVQALLLRASNKSLPTSTTTSSSSSSPMKKRGILKASTSPIPIQPQLLKDFPSKPPPPPPPSTTSATATSQPLLGPKRSSSSGSTSDFRRMLFQMSGARGIWHKWARAMFPSRLQQLQSPQSQQQRSTKDVLNLVASTNTTTTEASSRRRLLRLGRRLWRKEQHQQQQQGFVPGPPVDMVCIPESNLSLSSSTSSAWSLTEPHSPRLFQPSQHQPATTATAAAPAVPSTLLQPLPSASAPSMPSPHQSSAHHSSSSIARHYHTDYLRLIHQQKHEHHGFLTELLNPSDRRLVDEMVIFEDEDDDDDGQSDSSTYDPTSSQELEGVEEEDSGGGHETGDDTTTEGEVDAEEEWRKVVNNHHHHSRSSQVVINLSASTTSTSLPPQPHAQQQPQDAWKETVDRPPHQQQQQQQQQKPSRPRRQTWHGRMGRGIMMVGWKKEQPSTAAAIASPSGTTIQYRRQSGPSGGVGKSHNNSNTSGVQALFDESRVTTTTGSHSDPHKVASVSSTTTPPSTPRYLVLTGDLHRQATHRASNVRPLDPSSSSNVRQASFNSKVYKPFGLLQDEELLSTPNTATTSASTEVLSPDSSSPGKKKKSISFKLSADDEDQIKLAPPFSDDDRNEDDDDSRSTFSKALAEYVDEWRRATEKAWSQRDVLRQQGLPRLVVAAPMPSTTIQRSPSVSGSGTGSISTEGIGIPNLQPRKLILVGNKPTKQVVVIPTKSPPVPLGKRPPSYLSPATMPPPQPRVQREVGRYAKAVEEAKERLDDANAVTLSTVAASDVSPIEQTKSSFSMSLASYMHQWRQSAKVAYERKHAIRQQGIPHSVLIRTTLSESEDAPRIILQRQ